MQSQVEHIIGESSDSDFLTMYDTVIAKIDQLCLKTPDEMEETVCLMFKRASQPHETSLVGKVSKSTSPLQRSLTKKSDQTSLREPRITCYNCLGNHWGHECQYYGNDASSDEGDENDIYYE